MQRFSNILLVPLGQIREMPPGLVDAMDLVADDDASHTIIAVAPPARRLQHQLSLGDATAITDALVESLTEDLRRLAHQLRATTSVSVVVGRPPVEVVRAVGRAGHDLVIIVSDGSDDSAATTSRILRTCPCPVWVVRDRVENGRVLAAIDLDDDPALNRHILALADEQARARDAALEVIHAWQPYTEVLLIGSELVPIGARDIGAVTDQLEHAHSRVFAEVIADANLRASPTRRLVRGAPVAAITGALASERTDLLVMGSVGRSHADGVVIGTTAEEVLDTVDCSLLVVKPPGFVSPIRT